MTDSLLIECGNSRSKWGHLRDAGIVDLGVFAYAELTDATSLANAWRAAGTYERVILASVSSNPLVEEALALLRQDQGVAVHLLSTRQDCCGLHIAYQRSESLGVDRWLAMLAAIESSGPAYCIVDCGTAMTVDVVSAERRHLGGQIIPGLELMRNSLHHGTSLLPRIEIPQGSGLLGTNTEACIATGTLTALAGAVNLIREEMAYLGEIHGIITGGNARDVLPLLHGQWELRPNLVLEGMAVIDRYDEMGDAL